MITTNKISWLLISYYSHNMSVTAYFPNKFEIIFARAPRFSTLYIYFILTVSCLLLLVRFIHGVE